MRLLKKIEEVEIKERKRPKYTPLSKRQDRPDAILWLCKNASDLTDGQISKLVGSTLGFLKYNFYPAKLIMGDGGSYFLGFNIACIGLVSTNSNISNIYLIRKTRNLTRLCTDVCYIRSTS